MIVSARSKPVKSQQPTIGRLLRSLRARNHWTLKQMSARSGIPLSTLSKVEHDRLTLTYDKLQMLSQRLNMTMSELFAESTDTPEPAVTARRSLGRHRRRRADQHAELRLPLPLPELRRKRMIPVLANVRAKSLEEFGDLVRHSGEEFTYIIEGRVVLHTEFYDPKVMEVGESVYIDSNMGHAYLAGEGCDEAVVLCICSSAEETLMESLLNLRGKNNGEAATTAKKSQSRKIGKTTKTRATKPSAAPAL